MIRTKSKENYAKIIEVFSYYLERDDLGCHDAEFLMQDEDANELFNYSYHTLRRAVIKLRDKKNIGKKNFDKQKEILKIYKNKKSELPRG
jgi:hypothetical protein